MDTKNIQPLSELLTNIESLPPLEASKQELCQMVLQGLDDIDVDKLVRAIERSPSLAAKIIGLANSAYYCTGDKIYSIEKAIIRVLGLKTIKNLVLGFSLAESFDAQACNSFDEYRYWQTALLTAGLNRDLCKLLRPDLNPDTGYLVGLLFSIGQLALAHVVPDEYSDVLRSIDCYDEKFTIEKEKLGMHSGFIGGILAEKWSLPEEVVTTMVENMDPEYYGANWHYSLLTGINSRWIEANIYSINDDYKFELDYLERLGLGIGEYEEAVCECFNNAIETAQLAKRFVA